MSQPLPAQELLAIDLHGNQWSFRHSYRGNNSFYSNNSTTAIEVINPREVTNNLLIPCRYTAKTFVNNWLECIHNIKKIGCRGCYCIR